MLGGMASSFGAYLAACIKMAGMSRRAFARLVGYEHQNLAEVIKGKRSPPLERLDNWGEALGEHVDPNALRDLALLAHSPLEVQRLVADLRERIAKLERATR